MPFAINGIGTWYYGKSRIHSIKAVCSFCHRVGMLESYDTTHFIIVFHIPVIPLGRKRVLENCPHCRKMRVMPLKDWESAKGKAFEKLTEALQSGKDVETTMAESLGAASYFQDEQLLNQVAGAAAARPDAKLQYQLGDSLAYFARWSDAEAAYRRSLTLEDKTETRERLAHMLLKLGQPDDALPFMKHVLENKARDSAWLLYLAIDAYQSQGRHSDALALIDARATVFPELSMDKDIQKQRQVSLKHELTGKPIRSNALTDPSSAGYRDVSPWRSRLPRLIGPMIAAGLLAWYLGAAWWIGGHRKIYVLNGTPKAYSVKIAGKSYQLEPNRPINIEVPEGAIALEKGDIDWGLPPSCEIKTGFWSRPFASHMFVINPDRMAALIWEETIYSDANVAGKPTVAHVDKLLHHFDGIDYQFENFPHTIKAERGSRITKHRVGTHVFSNSVERTRAMSHQLPKDGQVEYARRMLRQDSTDVVALGWLGNVLGPKAMLDEIKPRLKDRPLQMEWHRMYQSLSEMENPDHDLRPEYRQIVDELKRSGDALYLLGRMEDLSVSEKLYEEAIAAVPPSAAALSGMGYRQLVRGNCHEAVDFMRRGLELKPNDIRMQHFYRDALVADGQFAKLAENIRDTDVLSLLRLHLIARVGQGDVAGASEVIGQALANMNFAANNPELPTIRKSLDGMLACIQEDRAKYLQLLDKERNPFELAFMNDDYLQAANHIGVTEETDKSEASSLAISRLGLVYLAADKANNKSLAAEQMKLIEKLLTKGGRDERQLANMLTGRTPFDLEAARRLPVDVEYKRVLLTILARQNSDHKDELLKLARKLNYQRDATALCLRPYLGE